MVLPLEDDLLIKTTPSFSEFLSKHSIHYRCFDHHCQVELS